MLFPRFSIQRLLVAMIGFAIVFTITRQAFMNRSWAVGVVIAVGFTVALFAMFAGFFATVSGLQRMLPNRKAVVAESPFATDKLPPQIIPPREPV